MYHSVLFRPGAFKFGTTSLDLPLSLLQVSEVLALLNYLPYVAIKMITVLACVRSSVEGFCLLIKAFRRTYLSFTSSCRHKSISLNILYIFQYFQVSGFINFFAFLDSIVFLIFDAQRIL